MKRLSLLNAVSGVVQVIINISLSLVIVPVLIHALGLETYGVYALVTAIGSLGIITNFGFNTSLLKFVAEQKDRQESNYDIVVTLIVMGGATLLVAGLCLAFSDVVLQSFLNLSANVTTPAVRSFYTACVLTNVFQMVSQVPSAVLDSRQKVYITNGVQLANGVVRQIAILCSLLIAPDLATVGWILLGSSITGMLLLGWFALRIWGNVSCPGLWRRFIPVASKHFAYGRSIYASVLMFFLYEPVTKVLISRYVGLTEVGYFDIALRIKSLLWSILERLLYPVMPLIAGKRDPADSRRIIEEVQHKLILIVVPVIVATAFLSKPVISVWLGKLLWPVVISVACIVICYLLTLLFVPLYQFLTVRGHPGKTFILQTVNVSVNVLLFAGLVPSCGYYGALAAYCAAVLSSTGLCAYYQWSILGSRPVSSRDWGGKVIKLALGLTILNGLGMFMIQDERLRIIVLMILNIAGTVFLFRRLRLVSAGDVEQYAVGFDRLGSMLEKLLVRET